MSSENDSVNRILSYQLRGEQNFIITNPHFKKLFMSINKFIIYEKNISRQIEKLNIIKITSI